MRAWRGLPNFRGQTKFSTWLYRMVANLCYSRLPQMKTDLAMLIPGDEAFFLSDERQEVE